MKKSENLFWIIAGLCGLSYFIYEYPLFFCQMEYVEGIVSSVHHYKPPLFYIEGCDYKFEAESRSDDPFVREIQKGDSVKIWFYRASDQGIYQWGHFLGEPYDYLVTKIKVNGKTQIDYSVNVFHWLSTLFFLVITVSFILIFIHNILNNNTKT